jgi:hypothetical protein
MKRAFVVLLSAFAAIVVTSSLTSVPGAAAAETDVRWQSDAAMHAYFVARFLESAGNGYERMLAPQIAITDSMWLTLDTTTLKIGTLELIGVANHPSPVAYVDLRHRSHPRNVETRPLSDFETQAIAKFRAGQDIIVQPDRRGRTVVGALRAQQGCLACHNRGEQRFETGDVLGALSYRLDTAKLPTE